MVYGSVNMVQSMTCLCCKRRFEANSADVLLSIPAYAAALYPVETKYALRNNCHLARNTTDVFESLIVTYGNGDLCSKLLYNAINRDYLRRVTTYYSFAVDKTNRKNVQQYLTKDGQFIRCFPPLGETIRDIYDQASSTAMNPWGISDKERHTREMQSVSCENGIFCQDHTFQAVRNYRKSLGAVAIWDVATSTGEIAAAVLVPSTKTKTFSHAAKQLSRRASFTPQAMYSDTWPNKDKYWESLFPNLQGRLGLFHFEKRIISTLKKQHIDYLRAINDLLMCLYEYCAEDYEQLLRALKDGTLNGKQHSSTDIADLQATKQFRDRYSKYLRKQMRQPQTMIQLLDDWFCRYKVTSSDPLNKPAKGRLDPYRNIALFTPETKSAVENCKEKAIYLGDPLPLDQMYDKIKRSPNAEHNLVEYLSKRGESKLEAYHDRAAHFANTGMRSSLCDNLNLCGTARYNLAIRQKRALISSNDSDRRRIPAGWEKVVPFWNHSELWFVNGLASKLALPLPFPMAERLPPDNGERFFSEYMAHFKPPTPPYSDDQCLCKLCEAPVVSHSLATTSPTENLNLNAPTAPAPPTAPPTIPSPKNATATNSLSNQNWQPQQLHGPSVQAPTAATTTQQFQIVAVQPLAAMISRNNLTPFPPVYRPPTRPDYEGCCDPYRAWIKRTGKKGRPPHDGYCRYRNSMHGYSLG
jgi:hypothetical protein